MSILVLTVLALAVTVVVSVVGTPTNRIAAILVLVWLVWLAVLVGMALAAKNGCPVGLTVLWGVVGSGGVVVGCVLGTWPETVDQEVAVWAASTAFMVVVALVIHRGGTVAARVRRTPVVADLTGPYLAVALAALLVGGGLTVVLYGTGQATLHLAQVVDVIDENPPDDAPAPRPPGWRPCSGSIGQITDPADALAAEAASRFRSEAAARRDWGICAVGPVVRVGPGHYTQGISSTTAGSLGFFSARYDDHGTLEVTFVPPQAGQVYVEQTDPGWQAGPPPWAEAWGVPGPVEPCGDGALQLFWAHGRVSGYARWSHLPAGPDDHRTMQAWFVPARVARAVLDEIELTGDPLPPALGRASADGAHQELEGLGRVEAGPDSLVVAGEIRMRCG